MKFIDLETQYQNIETDVQKRLSKVFAHGQFIKGPEVRELEEKLAAFVGVKHCIGVANGTDALQIALMAAGIEPGNEVITSAFTFAAPAEAAALLGAKVVFADIDAKTYNIDANLLEKLITPKTKAIIPVSLYGQCTDFDVINAIAKKHNIMVIEDAAQSFGATYKGRYSCALSDIACTSFFPSKPLGCYGDGGACFTNNAELAARLSSIANHGQKERYNHVILGLNSRLDTLQAAILLAKLEIFPQEIQKRNELASLYTELLKNHVQVPYIEPHNTSVFAQYTVACDNRDKICTHLQENGIPTAVHYPKALHEQIVFKGAADSLPNSEQAAKRVFSLPFSPYLSEAEVRGVVKVLTKVI